MAEQMASPYVLIESLLVPTLLDADRLYEITWAEAEKRFPECSVVTHDICNVVFFSKHRRLLGVETTGRVLLWEDKTRLWTTLWHVFNDDLMGQIAENGKYVVRQQYAPNWFQKVYDLKLVAKREWTRMKRRRMKIG